MSLLKHVFRVAIIPVATLALLMSAQQVQAESNYLPIWQGIYPVSTSETQAGRGGCQLCHTDSNGQWNGYGNAINQLGNGNITARIAAVQGNASVNVNGGTTYLQEISANAQPGWTTGVNSPVFNNGGNQINIIDAASIGVQPPFDPGAAEPNIAVAPTTLAFGIVDVGNSSTLTTTITNNGTADLNVTALNLSGTTEFALGTAPATPFTVVPNASANVAVVYAPVDNSEDTGSLTITSNDPDQANITLNLSGTGNVVVANACNFSVAQPLLEFGNVDIGTGSTLSTTVTNNGTAACNINASVSGSVEFALASGSPVTVAANGGTANVSVSYTPADVGADVGNLNLTSDDINNPQNLDIPLSGTGVQPPVNACDFGVAPTTLAFGSVTVGNTSTLSTTVTNNGAAACAIAASVTGSGDFTLASASPVAVAAGGTASVSVSYAPLAVGADSGNLNLTDTGTQQSVNVPLSGSAVDNVPPPVVDCEGLNITRSRFSTRRDRLRVDGDGGERNGGDFVLSNAFDPAQILATGSRRSDREFRFRVSGADPVPCSIRVDQPETGLCAIAEVDNAPADCAPPGPVEPPPDGGLTARGDVYATPVGDTIAVTASRLSGVLYNDFGGVPPLTAQLVSGPTAGSLDAFGADGSFTYTPGGSMTDNQVDQFIYVAVDANGDTSDPATVVIQTLSKQTDFKIMMNYELGMHCTGFEFAYCCVLPPYNSILAQVIRPAQNDPSCAQREHGCDNFFDGYPRMLEGDPNTGLDGLGRETVVRDWDYTTGEFKKYQLRYYHDAQPRHEGNTGKPNTTTLISAVEGNSLQYFNTVFDSAAPDPNTNALIYGPYNGVENALQGDGDFTGPTDNYANAWLNHFYIYGNLEGEGATGLEADKIRLGVAGQVEYPPNSGAALQPMGPTGNGAFENVLTFSADTGTVVFTQAKVLEDLPIMLTSPRIWEALGLPLTPFEDTIGFFADPGAIDEDAVRPYVAMKASLHEFPSGNAVIGSNQQPVIGFGTAPIDIPNCERCHSAPSVNPDTGLPNLNSPNWNRPDVTFPHAGPLAGTGLEDLTNLETNFWLAYYDIVPGVDSDWYPRLKGAAINMLTLHDFDVGTRFTVNYASVECAANPDPTDPTIDPDSYLCSSTNGLADLTDQSDIPQNTRLGNEVVTCQRCHADNVIATVRSATFDAGGQFPIPPISEALHNRHRNQSEGGVIVFNDSLGRDGGCQGCHPAHRSDGVMDDYPITLDGTNAQANTDNRLALGGCFVGRDVHSNPMKDVDGAETSEHLTAVGQWLSDNVARNQAGLTGSDADLRGIWCTNCHSQLSQEVWRNEDCNDLIHGDCLVNPRGENTLADVAAAVGWTLQQAIDSLDPKVDGFDRTTDMTHAVWSPEIPDADVATIEVDGGGNPVVTFDADGDPSVNILSFCTTEDCVDRINANKADQSQWRYAANEFIDPVNNMGAAVPFSAATDGRDHWLAPGEPHCADCHNAPYTEQSGNINPFPPFNYPAKASLMRYSRGHQDISCQGCHESIHGLYPVTPTIDTTSYAQAAALNNDGSHGPLKCAACHTFVDGNGIPNWVDNLRYNDPTTPGQDNLPVAGNFDRAVSWMHTYTDEANPVQDVCQNCHRDESDDISVTEDDYLEHAMVNRTSRVAMDAAERAVNDGKVFGEEAGRQRDRLCSECHNRNTNLLPAVSCSPTWNNHLIQGRVAQSVWEDVSAPLGGCGW